MLKMVIPKGRMYKRINGLMDDAGIRIRGGERDYRPSTNVDGLVVKLLKSANVPPLVPLGQHDCGFAGHDWVVEQEADVVEVLDLGFDPVRIVACIPESWDWEEVKQRKIIAVSEYRNICSGFLRDEGMDFTFLRSYGATEVFPPEDADVVVDNTSTGSTLKAKRLKIVKVIMTSSTRFIANKAAMDDPVKREMIDNMAVLFNGILQGRRRVLLEMNCPANRLEALVDMLPCMESPTVAQLYSKSSFAVKAAVDKDLVKDLIPKLREIGATDILEMAIRKVIP